MGEVKITTALTNALDNELVNVKVMRPEQARHTNVDASVDTGARLIALPTTLAEQLGLRDVDRPRVTLGEGSMQARPIRGYVLVQIRYRRRCSRSRYVGPAGSPVLLGHMPLEVMDLVVDCPRQQVTVSDPSLPLPHMALY